MSNGGLKVVYKELDLQIFHIEVKGPSVVTEDNFYRPNVVKLANLLKDELDLLLDRNCPSKTPVYAIIIRGRCDYISLITILCLNAFFNLD